MTRNGTRSNGPLGPFLTADVTLRRGAWELEFRLEVERGETVAIVGESGAGKTTALRCLAGLERPQAGTIRAGHATWLDADHRVFTPPQRRDVAMVFQRYALFGHMSALENAAFGPLAAGVGAVRARDQALHALEVVGASHLTAQRASTLSGGEEQRVALARAIALHPAVLLLDEPLAALDVRLRPRVREALRRAITETGAATVLVTHEPAEALAFAERFVVIENGRLVQRGTLADLREHPASEYVASFAGTNLYRGEARPTASGTSAVRIGDVDLTVRGEWSGAVSVLVDPDAVTLSSEAPTTSARNHLYGTVERVVADRGALIVHVATTPPLIARVTVQAAAELDIAPGRPLHATFKAGEARVL